jgi:hypothetical protein
MFNNKNKVMLNNLSRGSKAPSLVAIKKNNKKLIRSHHGIIILLILSLLFSGLYIEYYPVKRAKGDERAYIKIIHEIPAFPNNLLKCLPGKMIYNWWPPFTFSFYSFAATEEYHEFFASIDKSKLRNSDDLCFFLSLKESDKKKFNDLLPKFFHNISYLNLGLLLISGLILYAIVRSLGLPTPIACFVSSLVIFNPRIVYFVQGLKPELLHFCLLWGAVLFLIRGMKKENLFSIVSGSILLGFASLTKSVAGVYFMLLLPVLICYWTREFLRSNSSPSKVIIILACFATPFILIQSTQKISNYSNYGNYAINNEKWITIEMGLLQHNTLNRYSAFWQYLSNPNLPGREQESKQRVLKALQVRGIFNILKAQIKYVPKQQLNDSFLQIGIAAKRWGNSEDLKPFNWIAQIMTIGIVLAGTMGLVLFGFSSIDRMFLGMFLIYYFCGLMVVGFNCRFLIQALPPLAIFCGFMLKSLLSYRYNTHKKQ